MESEGSDGEIKNYGEAVPIKCLAPEHYQAQLPSLDYGARFDAELGEVAMVIQRMPGWVLLQAKTNYPTGIFRVPTGRIQAGESVEQAMLRELREEANLKPGTTQRLGQISYLVGGHEKRFTTTVFLIDSPIGELKPLDLSESINAWREAQITELRTVALDLSGLEPPRRAWGLFRSVLPQLLPRLMQDNPGAD